MEWQLIHRRAVAAAAGFQRSEKELVAALMEADRCKVFRQFGVTSSFQYCVQILKLSEAIAYSVIRVGRKSEEVPELKEALDQGKLSLSRAKRISSVVTAENQAEWIDKAQNLSTYELEQEVAKVAPKEALPDRTRPVAANAVEIRFVADDETLALLKDAQNLVSGKLGKAAGVGDAIKAALIGYVEKHDPVRRAKRIAERKAKTAAAKPPSVENAAPKRGAVNRPTHPTMVRGRRTPLPAETRHAVSLRDGGQCVKQLPDGSRCRNRRWTQSHHVIEVACGGTHDEGNIQTLCAEHHRALHLAGTLPGTVLHRGARASRGSFCRAV